MAETIRITTPFTEEMSRKLKAGDSVLITGTIISARDAAHKVMTEALARGEKLPVDWTNQIVYYLGPTPLMPVTDEEDNDAKEPEPEVRKDVHHGIQNDATGCFCLSHVGREFHDAVGFAS